MADHEIAALLCAREIDIAVDLNTHIAFARPGVFAMRPAPIQVSYLVYPGTSGERRHRLSDRRPHRAAAERPAALRREDRLSAGDLLHHRRCRAGAGDRRPRAPITACRRAASSSAASTIAYKVTADVFDVWMGLLGAVDGSVLWLFESNRDLRGQSRREAGRAGCAVAAGLRAARRRRGASGAPPPCRPLPRHLLLQRPHHRLRRAVDGPAGADLPGTTFAGRVGASLLAAVGLPELVTPSTEAYAALALELATTPAALAAVRAKLAANRPTAPALRYRGARRASSRPPMRR